MKNKGFTVIELLVSFVIIALIAGIGIISYNSINSRVETNYYKTLEDSLLLSGNEYFESHREELPVRGSNAVSVKNLIDGRYIEPIKDKKGNVCTGGSIYIYRNPETNSYSYEVCLDCGDSYKSAGTYCTGKTGEISVNAVEFGTSVPYNPLLSFANVGVSSKDVSATISLESKNNEELEVARYVIKNVDTGKVVYECTAIDNSQNKNSCNYVFKETGSYVVVAYNNVTQIADEKEINIKIDKSLPTFDINVNPRYTIEDGTDTKLINIKLDNLKDDFGIRDIKYCYNNCYTSPNVKNTDPNAWHSVNNVDEGKFDLNLNSNIYTLYVDVTDLSGKTVTKNVTFEVSYLIKLQYHDDYVQTFEVIRGQKYGYITKLPSSYEGKPIIWKYLSDNVLDGTDVTLDREHTLTLSFQASNMIDDIKADAYCKNNLIYNGENQLLTNPEPTGVTFIDNVYKDANEEGYKVTIKLSDGYVWKDNAGTEDRFINCSIKRRDITGYNIELPEEVYTYDANDKKPAVISVNGEGYNLTNDDYIISYANNIDAGVNATVVVTGKGNFTGTTSKTFEIKKRIVTVKADDKEMTYKDDKPSSDYSYTLTNNVAGENAVSGTANYTVKNGNTVVTVNNELDAGEYTIVPSNLTPSKNYEIEYKNGKLIVNRKKIDFPICEQKEYSGSEQVLFETHSSNIGTYNNDILKGTNVNTYTILVTPNKNYMWSSGDNPTAGRNLKCEIIIVPTTTTLTEQIKTYNGTAQTVTGATSKLKNNVSVTNGTYTYTYYKGDACTEANKLTSAPKDAGNYKVTAKLNGTSNYIESTSNCMNYTITRKELDASINSCSNKVYDESNSASCTLNNLIGVISGDSVSLKLGTCTFNNKNVGTSKQVTCDISLDGSSKNNYSLKNSSIKSTANITQRTVTITAPTVNSNTLTYSGSAQNLLATAGSCTNGGTMYWYSSNPTTSNTAPSFSTSSGWTTSAPGTITYKGTNAGTYYIWYYCYVNDTTNNTGTNINKVLSVTKQINKAASKCPTLENYTGINDGVSHTIGVSGGTGTINYRTSTTGEWVTQKPTRNVAGITTVYVKMADTNNYTGINDCGNATITLYNARIDFDFNGGTISNSGSNPIYVAKNNTAVYSGRTNSTVAAIPIVTKTGYTFLGWYNSAGTKVINADGTVIANISGWTDANKKWQLTSFSNDANTNTLSARYTANNYTVKFASESKVWVCSFKVTCPNGTEKKEVVFQTENDANTACSKMVFSSGGSMCEVFEKKVSSRDACVLNSTTYIDKKVAYDAAFNVVNPTCSGFAFAGWTATGDFNIDTAKSGTNNNPTTSWVDRNKGTYFKNLSTTENGVVTLTANWSSSSISFANQTLNTGTYGSVYTSNAFTSASGGSGNYSYEIKSGAPSGATIDSSTRKITFTNTTSAGTYNVVVTARDNSSGISKDATMTIEIIKDVCKLVVTNGSMNTGATMTLSDRASGNKGSLSYTIKTNGTTSASSISNGVLTAGAMSSANDTDQTVEVTITDAGNANYNGCSKDVKITVKKIPNNIVADNKTVYVNSTTSLSNLIKNNNGGTLSATKGTDNTSGSSISGTNFVAGTLAANDDSNKTVSLKVTSNRTASVAEGTANVTVTVEKYTRALNLTVNPTTVKYGKTAALSTSNGGSGGTPSTSITYASSNTNVFTVNGSTIKAVAASGTSNITATRAGSTTVKAATSSAVKVTADVDDCTFTVVSTASMTTGDKLDLSSNGSNNKGAISCAIKTNGTTSASSLSGCMLTAGAMSTANDSNQTVVVTLTDAGNSSYSGCSKDVTVTVKKISNSIAANNKTVYVNSTTSLANLIKNNNGGTLSATKGTDNTSGSSVSGTNFVAGTLAANDDSNKTVSLKVTSNRTASVAEGTANVTVTVEKYTRALNLTVNPTTVKYGKTAALSTSNGGSGGTPSTSITYASSNTNVFTVNGSTIKAVAASGTSNITATRAGSTTVKAATSSAVKVTAGLGTCNPPTNVKIGTNGTVSWTASSNATSYQISIDNTNWTAFTSGSSYRSTIVAATGTRNIYVRSVCDSTYYTTPSASVTVATPTVYKVTLTKGTGIDTVTGAGNYISGETVNIDATVLNGYTWSKWTQTTGGAQVSTTKAYSGTITSDWNYTASVTPNTYTIVLNNQSATTAGTTKVYYQYKTTKIINNVTCYYYTDSALTTCLSSGHTITKPTKTGYNFGGYYTATNGGGTNYVNASGQFINNIYQKLPNEVNNNHLAEITLYAKWTSGDLIFNSQTLNAGTYGTAYTSNAFTGASGGTGNYEYTIKSGAPTGAKIDSANRKISFTESTPAGLYSVVVTAKDNNSGATQNATMSITINKRKVKVTPPVVSTATLTYNNSAQNLLSSVGSCTTGGTMYWYSSNPTTSSTAPSFSTSSGWTTTAPSNYTGTNAETYYIWYYCKADANNNENDSSNTSNINTVNSVSKTIGKANDTITLNKQTTTYDGNIHTTSVSVASGLTPTITYYTNSTCTTGTSSANSGATSAGAAPKDAGTYYVTVSTSGNGNYNSATKSCTEALTISPKELSVSWGGTSSFTYNGSGQAPSANVTTNVSGETMTLTRTTKTDVGSNYTSTASCGSVSGGRGKCSNYTLKNNTKSFSITKRTVAVVAPTVVNTALTYSGSAQSLLSSVGSCTEGGTMYWYSSNPTTSSTAPNFSTSSGWTTTVPSTTTYKGTNAGTYYVWYYCKADTNNNQGDYINKVLSVNKAIAKYTPTISLNENSGIVDALSEKSFTATVTTISSCGGTLSATSADTNIVSISSVNTSTKVITWKGLKNTSSTNGIKINVNYAVNSTSNCNNASGVQYTAKVNRVTPTVTLTDATVTYSGSANEGNNATAVCNGNSVTLSYVKKFYTNSSCTLGETTTGPTNADTWYYKAISEQTDTFNSASSECKQLKINKYKPTVAFDPTTTTSGTVDYNDSNTFKAKPTTISKCIGKLTSTSTNSNYVTITDGGTINNAASGTSQTITYKGVGYTNGTNVNVQYVPTDSNNCDSSSTISFNVKVDKIDATCPTLTAYNANYDGQAHGIGISGGSGGTIQYSSSSNGTWSNDAIKITNVSQSPATVYVRVSGDGNHDTKTCGSSTITIKPIAITVTATDQSKGYDGKALVANDECSVTSGTLVSGQVVRCTNSGSQTNVGSSTKTLNTAKIVKSSTDSSDVSGNYTIKTANGTLTVTNAGTATIPTAANYCQPSLVYNGSEQTLTKTAGSGYSFSGNQKTNAGTYTITATLATGWKWSDNSVTTKTFNCTISQKSVTITAGSSERAYNGSALTNSNCTASGLVSGHTVTCTMTSGSTITDVGTVNNVINTSTIKQESTTISLNNYSINYVNGTLKITRSLTATTGSCKTGLVYSGSAQTLASGASNATYSNNSGTNANTYNVTVSTGNNYAFSDGSTSKTLSCTISPKVITITFYKNNAASQTNASGTESTANTVTRTCELSNSTTCTITSPTIKGSSNTSTVVGYAKTNNATESAWNHNTSKNNITFSNDGDKYYAITKNSPETFTINYNPYGNTLSKPDGCSKNDSTGVVVCSCTPDVVYNGASPNTRCNVKVPTITPPTGFNRLGWSAEGQQSNHAISWEANTVSQDIDRNGSYYAQTIKNSITYTTHFNKNGATTITSVTTGNTGNVLDESCTIQEVYNGATQATSCNITIPKITWTGYSYLKWSESSTSLSTTNYAPSTNSHNETLTLNSANTTNHEKNLYAYGARACYTVTSLTESMNCENDGLCDDPVVSGRKVFRGISVNNYVSFANKVWRIMAIEPSGELKLININTDGYRLFDTAGGRYKSSEFCSDATTYGCSAWSNISPYNGSTISKGVSSLNKYLNGTYYDNYLSSSASYIKTNMPIGNGESTSWSNLSGYQYDENHSYNGAENVYSYETVSIPTATDVLKASSSATSGSACSGKYSSCLSNNWIVQAGNGATFWLINPSPENGPGYKMAVNTSGSNFKDAILGSTSTDSYYPVIFLKNTVGFTSGEGTSSSPYIVDTSGVTGNCVKPITCTLSLGSTSNNIPLYSSTQFSVSSSCNDITITGNSNSNVATATVNGNTVKVIAGGTVGTTTIKVAATSETGTVTEKTYTLTTHEVVCDLSLSKQNGFVGFNGTDTFTISSSCSNVSIASNSNPSIATASLSGNTVTMHGGSTAGSTIVTIKTISQTNTVTTKQYKLSVYDSSLGCFLEIDDINDDYVTLSGSQITINGLGFVGREITISTNCTSVKASSSSTSIFGVSPTSVTPTNNSASLTLTKIKRTFSSATLTLIGTSSNGSTTTKTYTVTGINS